MYVPCWKPALHFFLTTGSPILHWFLQGAHIGWFNNINVSNTHKKRELSLLLISPSSPSLLVYEISLLLNHFMLILATCLLQKEVLRLIGTLCRSSSPSLCYRFLISVLQACKSRTYAGGINPWTFQRTQKPSSLLTYPDIILFYFSTREKRRCLRMAPWETSYSKFP